MLRLEQSNEANVNNKVNEEATENVAKLRELRKWSLAKRKTNKNDLSEKKK